jgi:hypothetical protein
MKVGKILKQDFILTGISLGAEILISFVTPACFSEPWGGLW